MFGCLHLVSIASTSESVSETYGKTNVSVSYILDGVKTLFFKAFLRLEIMQVFLPIFLNTDTQSCLLLALYHLYFKLSGIGKVDC